MAGWASNNQKLNSRAKDIENDFFMGAMLSQKSGVELMQNCDLPPPMKLFSGSDQMAMSRAFSFMAREEEETRNDFDETEKLELSKALRLSQTRAREAEKKAAKLVKEKEMICNGFLRESMQLLAYRHWVRLLEIQVWKMQKQQENKNCEEDCEEIREMERDGFSWIAALAICLGIAFGCTYFF